MELQLVALAQADEDAGDSAAWAARLLAELSRLDDVKVDVVAATAPDGAKGISSVSGALLARMVNRDALKTVLQTVRSWVTRTGRSVEVSIDGDVLKVSGVSREQQDRLIEAWLARHASAS